MSHSPEQPSLGRGSSPTPNQQREMFSPEETTFRIRRGNDVKSGCRHPGLLSDEAIKAVVHAQNDGDTIK